MPSMNVICLTLVLFLKQEIVKYHEILLLWREFFRVRQIVCRFIKITLIWLFGTSLSIFCQLMNQLVWWNLLLLYFILIFKDIHDLLLWKLFFKTFSQNFILWLKQNSFRKQKVLNSPTNLAEEEDSAKVLFFHSLIYPQSNPADSSVKEGDCFYLFCFRSMKNSLHSFILSI